MFLNTILNIMKILYISSLKLYILITTGFHVLMIVEASQNSSSIYPIITNAKLIVEICVLVSTI